MSPEINELLFGYLVCATLAMLIFFLKRKNYIYIFYHFSNLRVCGYLKSGPVYPAQSIIAAGDLGMQWTKTSVA